MEAKFRASAEAAETKVRRNLTSRGNQGRLTCICSENRGGAQSVQAAETEAAGVSCCPSQVCPILQTVGRAPRLGRMGVVQFSGAGSPPKKI